MGNFKEILLSHQKVSKYYENDCLLTILIAKVIFVC